MGNILISLKLRRNRRNAWTNGYCSFILQFLLTENEASTWRRKDMSLRVGEIHTLASGKVPFPNNTYRSYTKLKPREKSLKKIVNFGWLGFKLYMIERKKPNQEKLDWNRKRQWLHIQIYLLRAAGAVVCRWSLPYLEIRVKERSPL